MIPFLATENWFPKPVFGGNGIFKAIGSDHPVVVLVDLKNQPPGLLDKKYIVSPEDDKNGFISA
jgi:hypothetical protein